MACRIRCRPLCSLFVRYPIAHRYIRGCADIRCRVASHPANETFRRLFDGMARRQFMRECELEGLITGEPPTVVGYFSLARRRWGHSSPLRQARAALGRLTVVRPETG